ncbi:PAS domain S-box protein [Teredinibacter waterburyi]|uniref:PAS domain S-box protein n=1 Tax=Teredinibacter waterburyi TaxID=1500538 RepID=UPI00165F366D|nr:PAS domain S-box protein [Teredinibacter waterburyi]
MSDSLFTGDFMPHGHCYYWRPDILWSNVISDLLIGIAYFVISALLLWLLFKRKNIRFRSVFLLFAAFILLCGLTHLFNIYTVWHGAYGIQGLLKIFTAIASVLTAVVLFRAIPLILSIPTPAELESALKVAADERHKRLTSELERRAESIFKFATELIPTGLLVINQQQKVHIANRALEKMFGYDQDELVGAPLEQLIKTSETPHHNFLVEQYFKNPSQNHAMAEGRIVLGVKKTGADVAIEISLSVHEFNGDKFAFASIVDFNGLAAEKHQVLERSNRIGRAINAIDDGIWEWNLKTDDVWYSPSLMRLIGLAECDQQPQISHWRNHIHPDHRERVNNALEAHFNGEKYDVIYRGIAESGNYEWMHARGNTQFDAHNQPLLMSGTLANINEKTELEHKLADKSHFLNAVLNKSLCGTYILNVRSSKSTFINEQFSTITGYSLDDLKNIEYELELIDLVHPDDQAQLNSHVAKIFHNCDTEGEIVQFRLRHKHGHWIWCYSRDSVYSFDEDNKPLELLSAFVDITSLKEREESIKKLALDFYTTFEQAAVGIAHLGLDGNWLRINKRLCDILGYPHAHLMTLELADIVYPEDLHKDDDLIASLINGDTDQYMMEKRYIKYDGELLWVYITVSIARNDVGKNSHFIIVFEDISDRKAVEQALAESNASLERFAYSASHDLQEPLRKITTFSESLEQRLSGKIDDPDARYELNRISNAATRMREMIDSLLQLSRYSREKVDKTDNNLSDLVQLARDDLSALISESGAEIELTQDTILYVDKSGFLQVLHNLITNSIRYADLSKKNTIIKISGRSHGGNSIVEISDNGVGFSQDLSEAIFEPFKRLVGRNIKGHGMGLALCRQIVAAHGGTIFAKSSPNEGATFIIELADGD